MPLDRIVMEEGSYASHEADEWLPGVIDRLEEAEDYGFGPTIRWVLILDSDQDADYPETWALTSQKLTPRSKLYGWVKAIDESLIPEVGQAFKYKALEGRRVEVMFEVIDGKERVTKLKASKVKAVAGAMQKKQARTAVAKTKTTVIYDDDEAPF